MPEGSHYEYYEYDGVLHRLTYEPSTGDLVAIEGYFKQAGFLNVEAFPVLRGGQPISEKEFKAAVVAMR